MGKISAIWPGEIDEGEGLLGSVFLLKRVKASKFCMICSHLSARSLAVIASCRSTIAWVPRRTVTTSTMPDE